MEEDRVCELQSWSLLVLLLQKIDMMYAAFTGQPLEKVQQYTERDRFLSASEVIFVIVFVMFPQDPSRPILSFAYDWFWLSCSYAGAWVRAYRWSIGNWVLKEHTGQCTETARCNVQKLPISFEYWIELNSCNWLLCINQFGFLDFINRFLSFGAETVWKLMSKN